ncbi:hypothetical protein BSL78_14227 [Apostichopus japonicus]|uniref:Uncharacterized protein n=1 Tax=Stichopus japonicus TaxID=307972 RepID=A0A2G8KLK6_STIJA|nr:hypothetical protein BSL78_14227 [Apostichopus japonicus]
MAIRIWNFEFRTKMAPNLVNSQSTAEASTMPTEDRTVVLYEHGSSTHSTRRSFESSTHFHRTTTASSKCGQAERNRTSPSDGKPNYYLWHCSNYTRHCFTSFAEPQRHGLCGLGIWNGVFAIITGSFGIKSGRAKSMKSNESLKGGGLGHYFYDSRHNCNSNECKLLLCTGVTTAFVREGHGRRASYIIICLAYGLECLSCIIGASYTCVALCGANTQELQHVIVYRPYAMPPGLGNAANLYPGVVNMANLPASGTYGSPPTYEFATSQPEHKTYA